MAEAFYSGGCACGEVSLEISAEPVGPYQCYCQQCRHASGGGPATFVMAPRDTVVVKGETVAFEEPTASGRRASRSFCPKCGTALFSEPLGAPTMLAVKMSAIEDAPWDAVKAVFWTKEAPAWATLPEGAHAFETQP